jgi:hypothetical protein
VKKRTLPFSEVGDNCPEEGEAITNGSWTIGAVAAACWCAAAGAQSDRPTLRFAWPAHGAARVEITDERSVGAESRTVVMTMRLRVEPDGDSDRFLVRLSDAKLVSIDGRTASNADPARTLLAVGRVMKSVTPTMVVARDGRFIEARDTARMTHDVLREAGFPEIPPGFSVFERFLTGVAAEDWGAWVESWIGQPFVPVEPGGRAHLETFAVYPSSAVRSYTSGFLIDLAREAKELGDKNPQASLRFLESAEYGPMKESRSLDVESATMRPLLAERVRTFSATKGSHTVDGKERRTHRFLWETE